jgi:biopolymer transport protein ExbD
MKPRRRSSAQELDDHVDLTNVIDLTTVMSALFLVLAMGRATISVPIELSQTDSGSASASTEEQHNVVIDARGQFAFNETPISIESLRSRLAEVHSLNPDAVITIAGDKSAPMDGAVQLLSVVSELRLKSRFLAEPKD